MISTDYELLRFSDLKRRKCLNIHVDAKQILWSLMKKTFLKVNVEYSVEYMIALWGIRKSWIQLYQMILCW